MDKLLHWTAGLSKLENLADIQKVNFLFKSVGLLLHKQLHLYLRFDEVRLLALCQVTVSLCNHRWGPCLKPHKMEAQLGVDKVFTTPHLQHYILMAGKYFKHVKVFSLSFPLFIRYHCGHPPQNCAVN